MKITATSTTTPLGPATILRMQSAGSAGPREVLENLKAIAHPAAHGAIIHGRCRNEAIAAIAATLPCGWLALHQPRLDGLSALVVWPEELVGKTISYEMTPRVECPACGSIRATLNGFRYGKQRHRCLCCGRQWLAAA